MKIMPVEGEAAPAVRLSIQGRHGLFLNNSMDDNVLLGTKVADRIVEKGFQSAEWLKDMLAFMNLRFQGK